MPPSSQREIDTSKKHPERASRTQPCKEESTSAAQRGHIVCCLSEIMGRHRLTQKAVAQASGLRPGTISALYHDQTEAITKTTLSRVIEGLQKLTGMTYDVGDILQFRQ